ncbi:ABC transporter ATP-binding protein [Actinomyces bowdenii]|uniref:ABC transporter ATP-binding protein n=1 Tax=Actinomyces bowdenii TaxID=131109 RepID=UPI001ABD0343|nr:ABC transporter ATP-binding protein [Actinomyces bowdenii]MBO3725257.1 ABC transporter ATP-binding protein [Actinomyces bowdenii]
MSSAPVSLLSPHRPVEDPVVRARGLTKVYGRGSGAVTALDAVDVDIARARFTAIMGPSGSGKSTLMHCLAGLDSVSGGQIVLDGLEVSAMSQRRLTRLRRERIGFIFQSFNLVPTLTAAENITLPLDIARTKVDKQRFDQVIEAVGLTDRLSHRPAELSGGQVQRVACARALVGSPAVVFADEPTGNLDSRSTEQVLAILRSSVDALGQSVVMVTHEPEAAAWADTVVFLRDGQVVAELADPDRDRVLDALRDLGEGGGPAAAPGATGQQREPGAE